MRAFVFTDKSLASEAGRFAWLEMDTENPVNAPLRAKFPVEALPTFFIVDPADEKVALRWVGGMTLAQLDKILDDGVVAVDARHHAQRPAQSDHPRSEAFAGADQAFARA